MYWKGHCGVSLAVFAPIGFVLLRLGEPTLAFAAAAVMVGLTMLPDADHRLPLVSHRGVTHTLLFAAAVGVVFAAAGAVASPVGSSLSAGPVLGRVEFALFAGGVGFVAVLAHLLADALTPMGVPFLWPASSRRYTLSLWYARNRLANAGLFAFGVFVVAAAVWLAIRL